MLKTEKDVRIAGALIGFGLIWALAFLTGSFTADDKRDELFWTITAAVVAGAGWWIAPVVDARIKDVKLDVEMEGVLPRPGGQASRRASHATFPEPVGVAHDAWRQPLLAIIGPKEGHDYSGYLMLRARVAALDASPDLDQPTKRMIMREMFAQAERDGIKACDPLLAGIALLMYDYSQASGAPLPADFDRLWSKSSGVRVLPNGVRFFGESSSASRP
jgi:hypothetical protein